MRFRPSRRRRLAGLLLLAGCALPGCSDRSRPSPVDPGAGLSVVILSPSSGESFRPGTLSVSVRGFDTVGRLNALGVVLRTSPAGLRVDSVRTAFTPTSDTTVSVNLLLPKVSTPTGYDLVGFANNLTGGTARSGTAGLVVLPCPATGC